MKLSRKDKSLLLLIVACLMVAWSVYSILSSLFVGVNFSSSDIVKIFSDNDNKSRKVWFNTAKPLEKEDVKDKIILLNFWSYSCVKCLQLIPELKKLQDEYGNKLAIISVHSPKFSNEKNEGGIRKAIIRHDITNPVINDADLKIWNQYQVKLWPTLILFNTNGKIYDQYFDLNDSKSIERALSDTKKLLNRYNHQLSRNSLPIILEKNRLISNVLESPTKIKYSAKFDYKSYSGAAIFIANSAKNTIIISSISGEILAQIGSGKSGKEDGSFSDASFDLPQGLLYHNDKLYVADTNNHLIREVDFKSEKVTTILGSGNIGLPITSDKKIAAKKVDLASPTDIEFFPNRQFIAIANSASDQILSYDVEKKEVSVLAGSGKEGNEDGKLPNNSLAQTSDLVAYSNKLYFIDSKSNSLRYLNNQGVVETLIKGKLQSSQNNKNSPQNRDALQNPTGLEIDDSGIYISDSFDHQIKKYNQTTNDLTVLVGNQQNGDSLGTRTSFDEPNGIISIMDRLYVADKNNNRIVVLDRGSLVSSLLDIMPPLKLPQESLAEYLPNLQTLPAINVKADNLVTLEIAIEHGYKINEMGPSFINLLQEEKKDRMQLINVYDWRAIGSREIKLQQLDIGKNYMLQGVIYYCENKQNSLCYIRSYQQEITVSKDSKNDKITINIPN